MTFMDNYEELEPLQRFTSDHYLQYVKVPFKVYKVKPAVRLQYASGGSEDPDDAISLRSISDSSLPNF